MLHFRNRPLPDPAEAFLKELATCRAKNTVQLYRAALHHFHRFLLQSKLQITSIKAGHISEFDQDLAHHGLKLATRNPAIRHVYAYLRWLEDRGDVPEGMTNGLIPNYKPENIKPQLAHLPELASRFIEVLSAINKPNTVNGYKSCLRAFYRDHWKTGKPPYKIDRSDIDTFLVTMMERGLGPSDRHSRVLQLRRYLDWLYEHKKLKVEPDRLITAADFPRTQQSLPRPFPVDIDLAIQKKLSNSNDIDHLGLLLMRRTGLRVGELRDLTVDCISEDLKGTNFLRVPLGKLNKERVIPIDPETQAVVEKIKRHHSFRPDPQTKVTYLISNPSGNRRSQAHFGVVLREIAQGLPIPGKVTTHRLRHSFATSLLSAGLSITTLKELMGHRDIRMTLCYAAVTQETLRNEYFTALSKIQSRYEVASYPLKTPDLREGMNRAIYDAQSFAKKIAKDRTDIDQEKLNRLFYRLMSLRHELSQILKFETLEK